MSSPYSRYERNLKERSITAFSLLLLAGLFAIAGGLVAWHYLRPAEIVGTSSNDQIASDKISHLKFNDADFFIPAWLITSLQRTTFRKIRQINLAMPVGWTPQMQAVKLRESSDLTQWILVNIKTRKSFVDNKKWLTGIYRHYISGPATAHSSGLLRYRFKQDSPYSDLEIFTNDLQNPTVIIRCELLNTTLPARLCERHLILDSRFTTSYRFTRSQLASWQQVHQTVANLMKSAYKKRGV